MQLAQEDSLIPVIETTLDQLRSNFVNLHEITDLEYALIRVMNWEKEAVEEGRKKAAERARALFEKYDSQSSNSLGKKLVKASNRRG